MMDAIYNRPFSMNKNFPFFRGAGGNEKRTINLIFPFTSKLCVKFYLQIIRIHTRYDADRN